ncbi:MAG: YciI family protein, partial [Waterburya sp.]
RLAENIDDKRLALRVNHLRFMEANKERIFCGGPTVLNGQLEMMLIILNAVDLSAAEAFMQAEPYNQAGVFQQVTIREWRQVLPETKPGQLLNEINCI